MVKKNINDADYSFNMAQAWTVTAKNILYHVNGYRPNQLIFRRNSNLLAILNELHVQESISTNETEAINHNVMHSARK